ncbi:centrosomal protein of 63 kDa isoform X2 [Acipenser ruthenus]|uniref:centrosomal protein of 63 kDa isoform X2 n=1 Tax=Acipenser ruthenus TaxID=7906 RepID=UPI00156133C8|nr:centrosomal protein of 63 kDa isoform X2 [Acipenser ruthenus]
MEAFLGEIQDQVGRSSLTSCQAELQELMRQIDIMVAHKRSEWEAQSQAVQARLQVREEELHTALDLLEHRHKEVGMLRHQVEEMQEVKQEVVSKYEEQLQRVKEELARLKRSYEKLQRRQLKEAREGARSREEDQSEVSRLNRKLEEFRVKSLDWEQQRVQYQKQAAQLEAQRKTLAEQYQLIQEHSELASLSEVQSLRSRLERAQDTARFRELEIERLGLVQGEPGHCNPGVLREEKAELKSTLLTQDWVVRGSGAQQQQQGLCSELARLREALQDKEQLIRSLQSSVSQQGGVQLERALVQNQTSHSKESSLQAEVGRLQDSLEKTRCVELSTELSQRQQELRQGEEERSHRQGELKKSEALQRAEQTHRGEVEGMKREITQLTTELHQRDITIATLSSSASHLERQLRSEAERGERRAAELKHREGSLAELQQRYVSSFSELEEENQHLRRELAAARARLEMSAQDGQGRKGQQEEMQALRTRHHEEELSQQTAPPPAPRSLGSRSSSQDSLSSGCGSAPADSSDNASVESLSLPLAPLPASPADTVATRFLQEEDRRSQELLQRLDAHVQDLRAESRETVQKFQGEGAPSSP